MDSGDPYRILRDIEQTPIKRGFIAASAPALYLLLGHLLSDVHVIAGFRIDLWLPLVQAAVALLAVAGGLSLARTPRKAKILITAAVLIFAGIGGTARVASPATVLALLIFVMAALTWISFDREPPATAIGLDSTMRLVIESRSAALGSILTWVLAIPLEFASDPAGLLGPFVSVGIMVALATRLPLRESSIWRVPWWVALPIAGAGLALAMLSLGEPRLAALWLPVIPGAVLVAIRRPPSAMLRDEGGWWAALFRQPARLMAVTFLATCLAGGLLLSMPAASGHDPGIAVIDAIFTSFSATCVTGLVVLDTPRDFSVMGHILILLLIQIGGLGIMTFSTAAMVMLRQRLSMRYEGAMTELLGNSERGAIANALVRMLAVTFAIEALGTLLLALQFFASGDFAGRALWRGLFTAVSAFCNAGFALQTDNLIPYSTNPGILHVVAGLIIAGGLGPAVIAGLPAIVRGVKPTLHSRIVLLSTVVLLVFPAVLMLFLEWSRTLDGMSVVDRVTNAWFASVTTRTAGFNSVDMSAMHPASITAVQILMFIGGSPGSTAGGVKTTTVTVIVLAVIAALRGRKRATMSGWTIPHQTLYRAVAIVGLGLGLFLIALLALQLTQAMTFEQATFETLSALGTVGLSIGGTARLDSVGKVIVILVMYAGRIGPLTLFLFLQGEERAVRWKLPEQDIPTG